MANHWSDCPESLGKILENTENLGPDGPDYWWRYQLDFCKMGVKQRALEIIAFDRRLDEETSPTRATASLIAKRRELSNLHDWLRKAGR